MKNTLKHPLLFYSRKTIIHAFLLIVFSFVGVTSCKKEQLLLKEVDKNNHIGLRTSVDTLKTYYCSSYVTSGETVHEVLAYALSKLIYNSSDFRSFLISIMANDTTGNHDVLIGKVKGMTIRGVTIESMVNGQLSGLSCFIMTANPLNAILAIDPLVCVKITDEMARYQWNDTLPLPVRSFSEAGTKHFYNGELLNTNPDDLVELSVKTSEFYHIVNRSNGESTDGSTFFQRYGIDFNDCSGVKTLIQNKSNYLGYTGYSLVHRIDDVKTILQTSCAISSTSGTLGGAPSGGPFECTRVKLSTYTDYNDNQLKYMKLSNMSVFEEIDNQPCKNGPEENFTFDIKWAFPLGVSNLVSPHHVVSFKRAQVLRPAVFGYHIFYVYDFFCHCSIPLYSRYVITQPFLDNMWFDEPGPIALFSSYAADNDWEPEKQGHHVEIFIKEVDTEVCTGSTTQTQSLTQGASAGLGVKDIKSLSVSWSSTFTISQTWTISGNPVVDLGTVIFEYCQPYLDYPFMRSGSSSVNMTLSAPGLYF
ncbi:MAG TPA: hypothetical protein VK590_08055 [Saprospiraceae bacterium]|nr:hypothetical protein [Saprospiraceae bacterium]